MTIRAKREEATTRMNKFFTTTKYRFFVRIKEDGKKMVFLRRPSMARPSVDDKCPPRSRKIFLRLLSFVLTHFFSERLREIERERENLLLLHFMGGEDENVCVFFSLALSPYLV